MTHSFHYDKLTAKSARIWESALYAWHVVLPISLPLWSLSWVEAVVCQEKVRATIYHPRRVRACMVHIYIFIPLSPPLSSRCLDYKATWEHLDAVRPQSPAVTWANREQVTPYTPLFARVYPLCRQCFTMPCPSHTSNDFCALKLAGVLQPKWWYVHWSSRFTSYFFHHLLHSWIVLNIRKSLRKLLILSRRETWLDCYRSLAA